MDALVTGSAADVFCNNKFTLANVALNKRTKADTDALEVAIKQEITSSADLHMGTAAYIRNGKMILPT